jgi:hypothetical protein
MLREVAALAPLIIFPRLTKPIHRDRERVLVSHDLVHVAPPPVFAWLERPDHRVARLMEVLGRVLVLRTIATSHVPARQAKPQMNPGVTHIHAFLASLSAGLDLVNWFSQVLAFWRHGNLLRLECYSLNVLRES